LTVFTHPEFANHEQVVFCCDEKTGLRAIIGIHNTHRGPALGGCRIWPYAHEADALTDVLRLSRGMTYKSAISNLPLGGGKAVILGDPRKIKSRDFFLRFGEFVDSLGGRYITAEDSGTNVADMQTIAERTQHVSGIHEKRTGDGSLRSGDPSPATAYGVFQGVRAAVKHKYGRDDLSGLRVAIQGVGAVGLRLGRYLKEAGAKLWVADIFPEQARRAADELAAQVVSVDEIFALDVDLFAPCALGAAIDDRALSQLRAGVVAGAANNQLATPAHDALLAERGILYAPDYVINAGGVIDVCYEREPNYDRDTVIGYIDGIYDTLLEVFRRADATGVPTGAVADRMAEEKFLPRG
jgi:leucine dehydrogenase